MENISNEISNEKKLEQKENKKIITLGGDLNNYSRTTYHTQDKKDHYLPRDSSGRFAEETTVENLQKTSSSTTSFNIDIEKEIPITINPMLMRATGINFGVPPTPFGAQAVFEELEKEGKSFEDYDIKIGELALKYDSKLGLYLSAETIPIEKQIPCDIPLIDLAEKIPGSHTILNTLKEELIKRQYDPQKIVLKEIVLLGPGGEVGLNLGKKAIGGEIGAKIAGMKLKFLYPTSDKENAFMECTFNAGVKLGKNLSSHTTKNNKEGYSKETHVSMGSWSISIGYEKYEEKKSVGIDTTTIFDKKSTFENNINSENDIESHKKSLPSEEDLASMKQETIILKEKIEQSIKIHDEEGKLSNNDQKSAVHEHMLALSKIFAGHLLQLQSLKQSEKLSEFVIKQQQEQLANQMIVHGLKIDSLLSQMNQQSLPGLIQTITQQIHQNYKPSLLKTKKLNENLMGLIERLQNLIDKKQVEIEEVQNLVEEINKNQYRLGKYLGGLSRVDQTLLHVAAGINCVAILFPKLQIFAAAASYYANYYTQKKIYRKQKQMQNYQGLINIGQQTTEAYSQFIQTNVQQINSHQQHIQQLRQYIYTNPNSNIKNVLSQLTDERNLLIKNIENSEKELNKFEYERVNEDLKIYYDVIPKYNVWDVKGLENTEAGKQFGKKREQLEKKIESLEKGGKANTYEYLVLKKCYCEMQMYYFAYKANKKKDSCQSDEEWHEKRKNDKDYKSYIEWQTKYRLCESLLITKENIRSQLLEDLKDYKNSVINNLEIISQNLNLFAIRMISEENEIRMRYGGDYPKFDANDKETLEKLRSKLTKQEVSTLQMLKEKEENALLEEERQRLNQLSRREENGILTDEEAEQLTELEQREQAYKKLEYQEELRQAWHMTQINHTTTIDQVYLNPIYSVAMPICQMLSFCYEGTKYEAFAKKLPLLLNQGGELFKLIHTVIFHNYQMLIKHANFLKYCEDNKIDITQLDGEKIAQTINDLIANNTISGWILTNGCDLNFLVKAVTELGVSTAMAYAGNLLSIANIAWNLYRIYQGQIDPLLQTINNLTLQIHQRFDRIDKKLDIALDGIEQIQKTLHQFMRVQLKRHEQIMNKLNECIDKQNQVLDTLTAKPINTAQLLNEIEKTSKEIKKINLNSDKSQIDTKGKIEILEHILLENNSVNTFIHNHLQQIAKNSDGKKRLHENFGWSENEFIYINQILKFSDKYFNTNFQNKLKLTELPYIHILKDILLTLVSVGILKDNWQLASQNNLTQSQLNAIEKILMARTQYIKMVESIVLNENNWFEKSCAVLHQRQKEIYTQIQLNYSDILEKKKKEFSRENFLLGHSDKIAIKDKLLKSKELIFKKINENKKDEQPKEAIATYKEKYYYVVNENFGGTRRYFNVSFLTHPNLCSLSKVLSQVSQQIQKSGNASSFRGEVKHDFKPLVDKILWQDMPVIKPHRSSYNINPLTVCKHIHYSQFMPGELFLLTEGKTVYRASCFSMDKYSWSIHNYQVKYINIYINYFCNGEVSYLYQPSFGTIELLLNTKNKDIKINKIINKIYLSVEKNQEKENNSVIYYETKTPDMKTHKGEVNKKELEAKYFNQIFDEVVKREITDENSENFFNYIMSDQIDSKIPEASKALKKIVLDRKHVWSDPNRLKTYNMQKEDEEKSLFSLELHISRDSTFIDKSDPYEYSFYNNDKFMKTFDFFVDNTRELFQGRHASLPWVSSDIMTQRLSISNRGYSLDEKIRLSEKNKSMLDKHFHLNPGYGNWHRARAYYQQYNRVLLDHYDWYFNLMLNFIENNSALENIYQDSVLVDATGSVSLPILLPKKLIEHLFSLEPLKKIRENILGRLVYHYDIIEEKGNWTLQLYFNVQDPINEKIVPYASVTLAKFDATTIQSFKVLESTDDYQTRLLLNEFILLAIFGSPKIELFEERDKNNDKSRPLIIGLADKEALDLTTSRRIFCLVSRGQIWPSETYWPGLYYFFNKQPNQIIIYDSKKINHRDDKNFDEKQLSFYETGLSDINIFYESNEAIENCKKNILREVFDTTSFKEAIQNYYQCYDAFLSILQLGIGIYYDEKQKKEIHNPHIIWHEFLSTYLHIDHPDFFKKFLTKEMFDISSNLLLDIVEANMQIKSYKNEDDRIFSLSDFTVEEFKKLVDIKESIWKEIENFDQKLFDKIQSVKEKKEEYKTCAFSGKEIKFLKLLLNKMNLKKLSAKLIDYTYYLPDIARKVFKNFMLCHPSKLRNLLDCLQETVTEETFKKLENEYSENEKLQLNPWVKVSQLAKTRSEILKNYRNFYQNLHVFDTDLNSTEKQPEKKISKPELEQKEKSIIKTDEPIPSCYMFNIFNCLNSEKYGNRLFVLFFEDLLILKELSLLGETAYNELDIELIENKNFIRAKELIKKLNDLEVNQFLVCPTIFNAINGQKISCYTLMIFIKNEINQINLMQVFANFPSNKQKDYAPKHADELKIILDAMRLCLSKQMINKKNENMLAYNLIRSRAYTDLKHDINNSDMMIYQYTRLYLQLDKFCFFDKVMHEINSFSVFTDNYAFNIKKMINSNLNFYDVVSKIISKFMVCIPVWDLKKYLVSLLRYQIILTYLDTEANRNKPNIRVHQVLLDDVNNIRQKFDFSFLAEGFEHHAIDMPVLYILSQPPTENDIKRIKLRLAIQIYSKEGFYYIGYGHPKTLDYLEVKIDDKILSSKIDSYKLEKSNEPQARWNYSSLDEEFRKKIEKIIFENCSISSSLMVNSYQNQSIIFNLMKGVKFNVLNNQILEEDCIYLTTKDEEEKESFLYRTKIDDNHTQNEINRITIASFHPGNLDFDHIINSIRKNDFSSISDENKLLIFNIILSKNHLNFTLERKYLSNVQQLLRLYIEFDLINLDPLISLIEKYTKINKESDEITSGVLFEKLYAEINLIKLICFEHLSCQLYSMCEQLDSTETAYQQVFNNSKLSRVLTTLQHFENFIQFKRKSLSKLPFLIASDKQSVPKNQREADKSQKFQKSQNNDTFSEKPKISNHQEINALGDGNCAYNSLTLSLGQLVLAFKEALPEKIKSALVSLFQKAIQLNKVPNSIKNYTDIITYFEKNNHETWQRDLAFPLRTLAVECLQHNKAHCQSYFNFLKDSYEIFALGSVLDNRDQTFIVHHFILEKFKQLKNQSFEIAVVALQEWWEQTGWQTYLKEISQSAKSAGDVPRWGGQELEILAQYFHIGIEYTQNNITSSLFTPFGQIDELDEETAKLLRSRGIIEPDVTGWHIHQQMITWEEIESRCVDLTNLLGENTLLMQSIANTKQNKQENEDWVIGKNDPILTSEVFEQLLLRGIISKDDHQQYKFVKDVVIQPEILKQRLIAVPKPIVEKLKQCYQTASGLLVRLGYNGGHWWSRGFNDYKTNHLIQSPLNNQNNTGNKSHDKQEKNQTTKEIPNLTLEFTLASFIPGEAITHCMRRDLEIENNELIDVAILRYSHFMNWVKGSLWSDQQLNLLGNERIKADVLQIQVMFNQITDLKINGTLLCPIVFDDKENSLDGRHFSLLVFRKTAHDQIQAIYVDSYGDTADFGTFLVETFKAQFLQVKLKLQERLKEDKEQMTTEINEEKQIELTEIPWNLELIIYCEAYQQNNDCAVHVWQNALILADLDNKNFNIEAFKQKLKEKMLKQSDQVTLLRYQMAISLQNDKLFLQTHQAVVVTRNLMNHVNRINQLSSKTEQKIESHQINEDEESPHSFSQTKTSNQYFFSNSATDKTNKKSRENNNKNISASDIKNIFGNCLKKIDENFAVIELDKENKEEFGKISTYFNNKVKISAEDDCYKIKLTEKEYNNIMGEKAFQLLQMNLNLDDDEEEGDDDEEESSNSYGKFR